MDRGIVEGHIKDQPQRDWIKAGAKVIYRSNLKMENLKSIFVDHPQHLIVSDKKREYLKEKSPSLEGRGILDFAKNLLEEMEHV